MMASTSNTTDDATLAAPKGINALSLSLKGITPPRWIAEMASHDIGLVPHPHVFYLNPFEASQDQGPLHVSCQTCYKQYTVDFSQDIGACAGLLHHLHVNHTEESVVAECCHCGTTVSVLLESSPIPQSLLYRIRQSRRPQVTLASAPHYHDTVATMIRILENAIKPDSPPLNSESNVFRNKIGLDEDSKQFFRHTRFSLDEKHFHAPDPTPDNIQFLNRCRFQLQLLLLQEKPAMLTDPPKPAHVAILKRLGCGTYQRDPKEKAINLSDKATLLAERYSSLSKLGCITDMSDDIIIDAFRTQLSHDMTMAYTLIDTLVETQQKRKSEKLDVEVAIQKSDGLVTTAQLRAAYRDFEIADSGEGISDEVLLGLLRASIYSGSKESLAIIARSRNDPAIYALLHPNEEGALGQQEQDDPTMDLFYAQNPVGLTNIGNTCYVNSLLQYLYTIKELRETVLNMEAYVENTDAVDWKEKIMDGQPLSREKIVEAKETVRELKDLFSQMEWSKTRSVVPSSRLVDLLRPTGVDGVADSQVRTENQPYEMQDVSEAMLILMSRLNAAFAPLIPEEGGKPVDRFNSLFYVKAIRKVLETNSENGQVQERRISEDCSTLILNAEEHVTMEELIDNYFLEVGGETVDKPVPSSTSTHRTACSSSSSLASLSGTGLPANQREITVTALPPILQIYLNRTQFDRLDNASFKSQATIAIPKRLFMDQYLESNQEAHSGRIKRMKVWKKDRRECRRVLETIRQRRKDLVRKKNEAEDINTQAALLNAATNANSGLRDQGSLQETQTSRPVSITSDTGTGTALTEPATEYPLAVAEKDLEMEEAEQLSKIANLTVRLHDEVADLTQAEYKLHAVFHHEGDINFGHYWVDILDDQSDPPRWFKYSDERVNEVGMTQEDDVLEGKEGPTACFCVYVRSDTDAVQTVWRSITA
ncbi:ubiquitin-specific protease ubp2 [Mortierella claussenii]|nr:ubiquitin-specific protease ubp2 [Mortierella claussenii]